MLKFFARLTALREIYSNISLTSLILIICVCMCVWVEIAQNHNIIRRNKRSPILDFKRSNKIVKMCIARTHWIINIIHCLSWIPIFVCFPPHQTECVFLFLFPFSLYLNFVTVTNNRIAWWPEPQRTINFQK